MRPAVVRLLVAALLFAGWLGYLIYLVATTPRTPAGAPLVLSRPQILVSDFDESAFDSALASDLAAVRLSLR